MAGHDAGVQVECPGCGQVVLQKAMIPILGDNGRGVCYLCPVCARLLVAPVSDSVSAGESDEESQANNDTDAAGAAKGGGSDVTG